MNWRELMAIAEKKYGGKFSEALIYVICKQGVDETMYDAIALLINASVLLDDFVVNFVDHYITIPRLKYHLISATNQRKRENDTLVRILELENVVEKWIDDFHILGEYGIKEDKQYVSKNIVNSIFLLYDTKQTEEYVQKCNEITNYHKFKEECIRLDKITLKGRDSNKKIKSVSLTQKMGALFTVLDSALLLLTESFTKEEAEKVVEDNRQNKRTNEKFILSRVFNILKGYSSDLAIRSKEKPDGRLKLCLYNFACRLDFKKKDGESLSELAYDSFVQENEDTREARAFIDNKFRINDDTNIDDFVFDEKWGHKAPCFNYDLHLETKIM